MPEQIPVQIVIRDEKALEVVLKEYAYLKDEMKERVKVAFLHFAYIGAIAASIIAYSGDYADNLGENGWIIALAIAIGSLCFVAFLNMRWMQHCNAYLREIEDAINFYCGRPILGWERYANGVLKNFWSLLCKPPQRNGKNYLVYPGEIVADHPQAAHTGAEGA